MTARKPGNRPVVIAVIAAAVAVAAPVATHFEGFAPKPYLDPAAIRTVCYGETENVEQRIYSKEECATRLRGRMARDYAPKLLACVPAFNDPARRHQFGALLDASYNAGPAAACRSPMAKAFNAGRWAEGCRAFTGWYVTAKNRKTGVRVKLRGLERRREAERAVCLTGLG